ncbi:MAG: type IV pilus twitching motility protein PilT [Patescibacteria group bacterium]|nr:type IV pilus twitching motility protein PilT [Patescibacteria group bacterium]MDD5121256.1 type IV pilus twitching motility protein PilT [Patescibacteria group bacterium]MDD5222166.1 type IV pilus twitching motility protein PilT [Patescibacteria group bacterium]MDD5395825.1 type IV pilus twitching motility protein PilT [Patescibacteria group bacterium]
MNLSLQQIFQQAVNQKASDVHLLANCPPVFRVDGVLQRINGPILTNQDIINLVAPIIDKKQKIEIFNNKELDLSFKLDDCARFRINLYWEKNNLALAARIIWPHVPDMDEIDMPPITKELTKLHNGLIIVTGPTGCGKSTTMAAMINYINQNRICNIITLEDPIEFVFTPDKSIVSQRELGKDMLSFADGLKRIVRQDPNVIMVGEMRDLETISLALTLAETGHLILATLHTPNAPQTIDRVIDVFPPHQQTQIRLQLALALRAVIAQHLLAKQDGGRIAAREILINNTAVSNLIRENKVNQLKSVLQTGGQEGMISIEQSLNQLLKQGLITREVALAHTLYPELIIK